MVGGYCRSTSNYKLLEFSNIEDAITTVKELNYINPVGFVIINSETKEKINYEN